MSEFHALEQPRPLTSWESDVLNLLLSVEFTGYTELQQQLPMLKVAADWSDGDPTLAFTVDREVVAPARWTSASLRRRPQ